MSNKVSHNCDSDESLVVFSDVLSLSSSVSRLPRLTGGFEVEEAHEAEHEPRVVAAEDG